MENSEIQSLIESKMHCLHIDVVGDGYHTQLTLVSEQFDSLNKVKRNQLVYGILGPYVQSGELHAVTINAFTPKEWEDKTHG